MTTFTVDVSHWDWDRNGGNLDWPAIRRSGFAGVCIRASYGAPGGYFPTTRQFYAMARSTKDAGFPLVGGYHNLVHGPPDYIGAQVTHFRNELAAVGANWAMVDVEPYEALRDNNLWPRWEDVLAFQEAWYKATTRPLAFYIARWVWLDWLEMPDLRLLRGPLVSARYIMGTTQSTPHDLYERSGGDSSSAWAEYGNRVPDLWQYSSNAIVLGASRVTDVNAYRGTLQQLTSVLTGEPEPVDTC